MAPTPSRPASGRCSGDKSDRVGFPIRPRLGPCFGECPGACPQARAPPFSGRPGISRPPLGGYSGAFFCRLSVQAQPTLRESGLRRSARGENGASADGLARLGARPRHASKRRFGGFFRVLPFVVSRVFSLSLAVAPLPLFFRFCFRFRAGSNFLFLFSPFPFPLFSPLSFHPFSLFFPLGGGRVNLSLSWALFSMLSLSAQSLASRSFVLSEKFVKAPSTMILRDKTRA